MVNSQQAQGERSWLSLWFKSLLDAIDEVHRAQDGLAGLIGRFLGQRVFDLAAQDLHRDAVHGSPRGKDLRDDLLAGLSLREHADNAANLPLDASEPQLDAIG